MKRVMMAMALVMFSILPARAHMIHLVVQHHLQGNQAAALTEIFEAYNHRSGHGAHIRVDDGQSHVDLMIGGAEELAERDVLLLDEWLDTETREGLRPQAWKVWRGAEGVRGLPLTADGSLGMAIAMDSDDPHEAYELLSFLAGPEAGRIWVRVTGQPAAHRAVPMEIRDGGSSAH